MLYIKHIHINNPLIVVPCTKQIPNAIDLGTMEMKLKKDLYRSTTDFKADVALLYQNSVDFNGINHPVTSAAIEVRNAILLAVSEMEKGKTSTGASVEGL